MKPGKTIPELSSCKPIKTYFSSFLNSGKVLLVKSCRFFRLCGSAEIPKARLTFLRPVVFSGAPPLEDGGLLGNTLWYMSNLLFNSMFSNSNSLILASFLAKSNWSSCVDPMVTLGVTFKSSEIQEE